jgi:hypothetical protein|nr:hypothetical protein [uncultured Psychroserpens sp.]
MEIANNIKELSLCVFDEILNIEKSYIEFESFGIKDGKRLVFDFLENNELGLAFEHIKYVISETEIKLKEKEITKMKLIALKLKI